MSTFKKKAKVVMLSTNEPSKIGNLATYQKRSLAKVIKEGVNPIGSTVQFWNLYIISDDEIKLFDWIYNNKENIVEQITSKTELIFVLEENKENQTFKKVIATTYTSLDLPQPSQQFIQKYIEEYNKGREIKEVLVEYELISNEEYFGNTFNPDDDVPYFDERLKINPKDNTFTIKKVKDSYTQEEVDRMLDEQASKTTAEMLEKFKDYKSREEVEILCRRAYREGQNYDAPDQCIMSDKISIEEFIRQNL